MKLLCLDMDGVLIDVENFWLKVHEAFGTLDEGKLLTDMYLHTDYEMLVHEVVGKLWKGRSSKKYEELIQSLQMMDGITDLFAFAKEHDLYTVILSGGSYDVAKLLRDKFGISEIHANQLGIEHGKITGEFTWPVGYGKEHKARILSQIMQEQDVTREDVVYVGDTEYDVEAFALAGHAIAFNCSSELLKAGADYIVDSKDLRDVVKLLKTIQTSD